MAAAGFTVIRVGESVWSTWEPENGRFDLDWLQPVLDGAHERGISRGPRHARPTRCRRGWPGSTRRSPASARTGRAHRVGRPAGGRLHPPRLPVPRRAGDPRRSSPGTPTTRPSSGSRSTTSPACELFHNHGVFQRFVDDLRHRYGDVETLNREWGLVYWSHRLSTWADLWRPDGNAQPQYDAGLAALPGRLTTEFIAWQAGIVREYASPGQFVTTCIAYGRPGRRGRRADRPPRRRPPATPTTRCRTRLALPDRRARRRRTAWMGDGAWALYQQRRPDVLARARSRSWSPRPTPVHRHRRGQPAGLRRAVAAGRLGARRPRRADDRVLALAHAALRRRDLLGRDPPAQRPARTRLPRRSPASAGARHRRRTRRRADPGRRRHAAALLAHQVADAGTPAAGPAGRQRRRRLLPRILRRLPPRARSTPGCRPASSTPASS